MKKKNKNQEGTSLVEVILCLFLIAVLLVFYAAALNTVALTKKLRYENLAYHVANTQMETLRGTAYASLPANGAIADPLLNEIPSGAGNYVVADYVGHLGMKEATITITWNDGQAKSLELKTLILGPGGIGQ